MVLGLGPPANDAVYERLAADYEPEEGVPEDDTPAAIIAAAPPEGSLDSDPVELTLGEQEDLLAAEEMVEAHIAEAEALADAEAAARLVAQAEEAARLAAEAEAEASEEELEPPGEGELPGSPVRPRQQTRHAPLKPTRHDE